ncbi:hypothetical protein [Bremerella sp.]|uniref:hypothetical protein n=1 Tax=Bremerella sp. TaxID=2795602 RepID=UPI00391B5C1B
MSYNDDQDFASDSPPQAQAVRSQLSLLDIMVGVAIAAVTCGFWLQTSQPQMPTAQIVFMIPTLIIYVLGGTTLFSFGRRYLLKQTIDFQPGHWLLCLMGVSFVIQSSAHLLRLAFFPSEFMSLSDNEQPILLFFIGQHVLFLVCYLVAGFLLPVRPAWRLTLVTPVLQSLLILLLFANMLMQNPSYLINGIYSYANVAINLLGIFIILGVAVWDRATTHDHRDWLHWLGVVAILIWNLPMLVLHVVNSF